MTPVVAVLLVLTATRTPAVPAPADSADSLPRRHFIGAAVAALPDSLRSRAGGGVLAIRIQPASPAAAGGVRAGDVIQAFGDTPVTDPGQFVALVRRLAPGVALPLAVVRGGQSLTLSVTPALVPLESAPDFDVSYTSVRIDSSGGIAPVLRRVIVTHPRRPGRLPAVLFVGGIGCYSVDAGGTQPDAYVQLLYHLTRQGFVTVRVEKSGVGDSEGPPCSQVDLRTEVAGYAAALRWLKQYPFVDPADVIVFGHSIGGILAPLLAGMDAERDSGTPPVRGIVAMSTVGIAWFEYELANLRRQLVLGGMAPDSVEEVMREKERCMHSLLVDKVALDELLAAHPECTEAVRYPAHYSYMQQAADLDIPALWRPVMADVLVIYPTSDFITSGAEQRYLVAAINRMHPRRPEQAIYAEVPGMDHYLAPEASQLESYRDPRPYDGRPLSTSAFPVLDRWLARVAGRRVGVG